DYLDALEYTLGVVGEDHVVVGTDITEGQGREFLEWTIRHRGDGRLRIDVPPDLQGYPMPADFAVIRDIATLPDLLRGRGGIAERIGRVALTDQRLAVLNGLRRTPIFSTWAPGAWALEDTVDVDRWLRLWNYWGRASEQLDRVSDRTRTAVEAFAAGVNRYYE